MINANPLSTESKWMFYSHFFVESCNDGYIWCKTALVISVRSRLCYLGYSVLSGKAQGWANSSEHLKALKAGCAVKRSWFYKTNRLYVSIDHRIKILIKKDLQYNQTFCEYVRLLFIWSPLEIYYFIYLFILNQTAFWRSLLSQVLQDAWHGWHIFFKVSTK